MGTDCDEVSPSGPGRYNRGGFLRSTGFLLAIGPGGPQLRKSITSRGFLVGIGGATTVEVIRAAQFPYRDGAAAVGVFHAAWVSHWARGP